MSILRLGERKLNGELRLKRKGKEGRGTTLGTPFLNKMCLHPINKPTEGTLVQILAGYKLELGATIASDWLFGLQKCAWLTYGQASLTLGHYLRVEEEGSEQMKKNRLQTAEKCKLCCLNWVSAIQFPLTGQ